MNVNEKVLASRETTLQVDKFPDKSNLAFNRLSRSHESICVRCSISELTV